MDKAGMFGEMLEKGQQTVQNTAKSAVADVANSVAGQVGVKPESSPDAGVNARSQNQTKAQNSPKAESAVVQAASTPETLALVKEFYAPSQDLSQPLTEAQQKDQLETQQKLVKLRQELHQSTYYEEEEATSEKVEREEKEEQQKKMQLEEKKAKEKQDIATSRAQRATEANRGVAG